MPIRNNAILSYIYIYIYTLSVFLFRGEIGWMENSGEKIERKTFL